MSGGVVSASHAHTVHNLIRRRLTPDVSRQAMVNGVSEGVRVLIPRKHLTEVWDALVKEGYTFVRRDDSASDMAELKITGKALH